MLLPISPARYPLFCLVLTGVYQFSLLIIPRLVKNSLGAVSGPVETSVRITLPVMSSETERNAFTTAILNGALAALGKGDAASALALATGAASTMNLFSRSPLGAEGGETPQELEARLKLRNDLLHVVEEAAQIGRPRPETLEVRGYNVHLHSGACRRDQADLAAPALCMLPLIALLDRYIGF